MAGSVADIDSYRSDCVLHCLLDYSDLFEMKRLNIALVAHDGRKQELIEWVRYNYEKLSQHNLFATGTTGRLVSEIYIGNPKSGHIDDGAWEFDYMDVFFPFKNNVTCLLSGPLGGDQEIGAMIAEGQIDVLIFFCDNLIVQGHQNDVSALGRLASLYNIAYATNRTTADMVLTSPLFGSDNYRRILPTAIEKYKNRSLQ